MAPSMTGLTNSRRRFDKVSYTPVQTSSDAADNRAPMGALNLAALVRTLEVSQTELQRLAVEDGPQRLAVDAVTALIGAVSGARAIRAAATLGAVPTPELATLAERLGQLRASAATAVATARARLLDAHAGAIDRTRTEAAAPGASDRPTMAMPAMPAELAISIHGASGDAPANVDGPPPEVRPVTGPLLSLAAAPAADAMAWARDAQPELLATLDAAAAPYRSEPLRSMADVESILSTVGRRQLATELFTATLTQRPLEPIGLLHLERMDMTPVDVERGELLYSLPLAPREKVTLAHREWTTHQEEFQRYVQDYQENFSQTGVAQSDDISMATQTQSSHSNGLSMGSQPTSTTPATITPPVPSTTSTSTVDDLSSQSASKSQSRTVTALASARTIKDQKISFTVTTVAGVEDFTAQVIENPHDDHALRVDYYRRMRRWRTELYRYGVRMTYDVVLPDPGQLLRVRQVQIAQLEADLSRPFAMDLAPSDLTPDTWQSYGDRYGVALQAPPLQSRRIETTKIVGYDPPKTNTDNWIKSHFAEELPIGIPDGYQLSALHVDVQASTWITGIGAQWITVISNDFHTTFDAGNSGYVSGAVDIPTGSLPTDGTLAIAFRLKGIMTGELIVVATVAPSQATNGQWQQQAWTALRDKAYADHLANLDRLRQQRASLVSDINAVDALTLRRLEREQIMRATLEWLFPGFGDASSVLEGLPDPSSLDNASWQKVMQYGEYIKFVQSAIDWDNVLVLLYPYFWDTLSNQQSKLSLSHPDPLHRDFLRAGAARVILAIQPGFEESVVSLLDQGKFGSLGQGTAFAKVATDVQAANAAYAKTMGPTAADVDDPRQPGVLIGSWHDYTPTPALDIDVTRFPVLDGTQATAGGE